jgi:ubiquinone/menaquinone biosynthesis C-methylase UbiE
MKGHKWFAGTYDFMNRVTGTESKFMVRHRPRIVGEAQGRVLEVGAGTGASFPYYAKTAEVIATEPDPYMLERAKKRLEELGVANIELRQAGTEELPFEDASFDTVVSTLVFCSVDDPAQGLRELRRVLKPGGSLRFVEHVRADGWKARVQDAMVPLWSWLGAGCHPNRRTLETMKAAGFEIAEVQRDKLSPVIPVVIGVAHPNGKR